MPRPPRFAPADRCYHVINRGNGRAPVFHSDDDYFAFIRVLSLACERHAMRLLAFCLMPNHFHFVLWPRRDGDLQRMMQWLTTCHVRRYHRFYQGSGHVWQGRYKSFVTQSSEHLLTVLRYVERNPVRARLVKRAQHWRFSSAKWGLAPSVSEVPDPISSDTPVPEKGSGTAARSQTHFPEPDPFLVAKPIATWLEEGPIPRPRPWLAFVNRAEDAETLARLRQSVNRGAPFGDESWQQQTARKLGIESTLTPRGRPPKRP